MDSHSNSEKHYTFSKHTSFYVWTHIGCLFIIVNIVDISGQAKVCDLHNVALCDQDIPGCKVSVYTLGWHSENSNSEDILFRMITKHRQFMQATGMCVDTKANMSNWVKIPYML